MVKKVLSSDSIVDTYKSAKLVWGMKQTTLNTISCFRSDHGEYLVEPRIDSTKPHKLMGLDVIITDTVDEPTIFLAVHNGSCWMIKNAV